VLIPSSGYRSKSSVEGITPIQGESAKAVYTTLHEIVSGNTVIFPWLFKEVFLLSVFM
jgi:hypothetical protein